MSGTAWAAGTRLRGLGLSLSHAFKPGCVTVSITGADTPWPQLSSPLPQGAVTTHRREQAEESKFSSRPLPGCHCAAAPTHRSPGKLWARRPGSRLLP